MVKIRASYRGTVEYCVCKSRALQRGIRQIGVREIDSCQIRVVKAGSRKIRLSESCSRQILAAKVGFDETKSIKMNIRTGRVAFQAGNRLACLPIVDGRQRGASGEQAGCEYEREARSSEVSVRRHRLAMTLGVWMKRGDTAMRVVLDAAITGRRGT